MVRSRNNRHLGPPRLEASQLYQACDPALLAFATTAELEGLDIGFGQRRALAALELGLGIPADGYNLFVLGPAGSGRHGIVQQLVERVARARAAPDDWCYVHNFDDHRRPVCVRLPAGKGIELRRDMARLTDALRTSLPAIMQSEPYRARVAELDRQLEQLHGGAAFEENGELSHWHEEHRRRADELNREVVERAAGALIRELEIEYQNVPALLRHLDCLRQTAARPGAPPQDLDAALALYEVNLLVDRSGERTAPVVYENHPTAGNLLGRVAYRSRQGALVSDFTMILPGATHRANGGYLILDAERVLGERHAWNALKRTLAGRQVRIEPVEPSSGSAVASFLEPEAIPLDLKVVLIGERSTYYLLHETDPDFCALFKVAADFENRIDRTPDNTRLYARLIATLARREQTLPLTSEAVAHVIEHGARLLGDAQKLPMRLRDITDLLREADYWGRRQEASTLTAEHVRQAVAAQVDRLDRLRAETLEEIERNGILIDTDGAAIGQVNGLTVIEFGGVCFGQPARITANVRLGEGEIVDIERETELGGAVHSKGVLILSAYLASRYATDIPLSMAASLVFEQSYVTVEGDSASLAETCALLSALSGLAVKQSLAVTGSVDQHGRVQVIGGLHEKIEGFFDICRSRGFTGAQGVVIPADNVQHLMLRRDVVEAVGQGHFHVYPVHHIDDAIAALTDVPAGQRNGRGEFPEGTVNHRIEQALKHLAAVRKDFDQQSEKKKKKSKREE